MLFLFVCLFFKLPYVYFLYFSMEFLKYSGNLFCVLFKIKCDINIILLNRHLEVELNTLFMFGILK